MKKDNRWLRPQIYSLESMESLLVIMSVGCAPGFVSEPTNSTKAQSAGPICGQGSYKIYFLSCILVGCHWMPFSNSVEPVVLSSAMIADVEMAEAESFLISLVPALDLKELTVTYTVQPLKTSAKKQFSPADDL
uniref:Uncharacterized protein n=1 Tax=Sphaerodactylus townsendi TaxID=933632 RepID=A0ACB8FDK6_9SAUR